MPDSSRPSMTVLGHEIPRRIFRSALAAGRLAPAYLLSGPEGIGKATLARHFTALLLCRGPETSRPCGACAACGRLDRSAHPAFHVLALGEDEREIKIESVRRVLGALALRPADGDPAVVLIDGADRVSEEGLNALLKTLEEPPPYARFLLATSRPEAILATVVSRCQILRCAPLPEADVRDVLRGLPGIPPDQAAPLAALAGGSPGRAIRWGRSGLLERREWIAAVFDGFSAGEGHRGVDAFLALGKEGQAGGGASLHEAMDLLARIVSELLRALLTGRRGGMDPLLPPSARRWADRIGPGGLTAATEQILDAQADMDHNVNPKLAVEDLFLRLGRSESTSPA